jgi:hypothetical protein
MSREIVEQVCIFTLDNPHISEVSLKYPNPQFNFVSSLFWRVYSIHSVLSNNYVSGDASTFQISRRHPHPETINERSAKKLSTTSDKKRKLGTNTEDDSKKKPRAERKRKAAREDTPQLLPPHILQPLLQEVFDDFWNMELQPEVAIPFFTTITRDNCIHLGMPDFYDKISTECTFATMKVWFRNDSFNLNSGKVESKSLHASRAV